MRWGSPLLVALVVALMLSPGATAAPTWLPPVTVSSPGEENDPGGLGVGADGTVIAVWQRATCTQPGEQEECKDGRIVYSARPPGGNFSTPAPIPGDPEPVNLTLPPSVAFDGAGNAIAVWTSGIGMASRVRYSMRPSGGEFGPAQPVDNGGGEAFVRFPDVAMAPSGRGVVAFTRSVGGKLEVWYAVRPPGGNFGAAKPMIDDPGAGNINATATVSIDPAGEAIATWVSTASVPITETAVRYAVLPAGGEQFSKTETVEPGGSSQVAMAPSGAAVMVWRPPGAPTEVRYAFRAPGGPFGAPRSIPDPDLPRATRVVIAADGSAVAAWTAEPDSSAVVHWSASPPGGPFGPPLPLPGAGPSATLVDLSGSDQGAALALWLDHSAPATPQLQASLRPPGGAFGTPTDLPSPPQGADRFGAVAAFDSQGNAAALWHALDPIIPGPHDVPLLAAGLDAAGPRLDLQAAASVPQGRPLNLTLAATDVWSSVASTRIDFGDGGGAPGPTATHRYDPGTYSVVGSATDSLGNASSLGHTLRVLNVKPGLSGLRVVPKRFAVGPGASRKAVASIRFRLTERASVRVTVKRRERKAGGKRGHRLKKFGRVVFKNRRQGRNRVGFSGRLKGAALPVGRYVLAAVAVDRTKKRSRPRRTAFRVMPRRR